MQTKRIGVILALALVVAALLVGCAPSAATPSPASKLSSTSVPTKAVEQVTPDPEVSFAAISDFSRLQSYRLVHTYRWKQDNGESGRVDVTREVITQPEAMRMTVITQDSKATRRSMELLRVNGATYMKYGDRWADLESQGETLIKQFTASGTPEQFLANARGQFVVKEILETYGTRHYRFTKDAFTLIQGMKELTEAKADAWVSPEYNVYLRVVLHLVALDEKGVQTTIDIQADLSQINQPLEIQAPTDIVQPQAMPSIPIMPGATDTVGQGDTATYKVKASLEEVVKFFQEKMPPVGWTAAEGSTADTLYYERPGAKCVIKIKVEGEEATVAVTVTYE